MNVFVWPNWRKKKRILYLPGVSGVALTFYKRDYTKASKYEYVNLTV